MQRLLPKRKKVQPDNPRAELPLLATFGLFVCWFFWLLSHSSNFKCSLIGVPIFMVASRPCIPFLKWLRNGKHLVIALLSLYGKQSRPPWPNVNTTHLMPELHVTQAIAGRPLPTTGDNYTWYNVLICVYIASSFWSTLILVGYFYQTILYSHFILLLWHTIDENDRKWLIANDCKRSNPYGKQDPRHGGRKSCSSPSPHGCASQ